MRHSYAAPFRACCVGNNKTLMFQSFLARTWDVSITYPAARSSCLCIVTSTHFHTYYEPTGYIYIYICLHIFVHDKVGTWLKMIACSISLNVCITTGTSSFPRLCLLCFSCCLSLCVCVLIKGEKAQRMCNWDSWSRHLNNNQRVSAQLPV